MSENISNIEPGIENGAVNLYQNDMTDEFPVLKAFQQYIDAEQAKSRKRMTLLCLFFSVVLIIVIGVFVGLLVISSARNQSLNDRLVEYAMKERDHTPVVTQTPPQDDSVLRALSEKFDGLQKAFADEREKMMKKIAEDAATKTKKPSVEELEIARLKALLSAEKEKAAAEREKQRQNELEAYRRKHYPEFYNRKMTISPSSLSESRKRITEEADAADREIDNILKDVKAVEYFDEDDDGDENLDDTRKPSAKRKAAKEDVAPSECDVEVPHEIKDSSGNAWRIPEE